MKKRALVLGHVAFEDLGSIAAPFQAAGYEIDDVDATLVDFAQLDEEADVLVLLGGPIGVGDGAVYPIIDQEIALVRRRLAAKRPMLGICLGAQVIAAAMGARVYPGAQKEIGWAPLSDCSGVLAPLAGVPVLHWHGDTFNLAEGCRRLASTEPTPNQAFAYEAHVLALQFHMEVNGDRFEHWLMGHANEIAHAGLDVQQLRQDAVQFGPELQRTAPKVIADWLAGLR